MTEDLYGDYGNSLEAPAKDAVAVTLHDTNDLTYLPRAIYIGVSGDVKVDMIGSGTVTFLSVPIGILPVRVTRVYNTGTSATNIIAIW